MKDHPPHKFSGPELCKLEAHEAVLLLKKGEVSPKELLDAAYARIEATTPLINATVHQCRERAYALIAKLDASNHHHPGWLAGLPIGIKDLTPIAGVRTTYGTIGYSDNIPDNSDPLVDQLEKLGAIVTGKTNTPEFGAGGNTFNKVYGPTKNPWDTRLNAGGSSGGAAASLAAGETWLSHGSDHGGSLRTPAAFCGVVGLRPSPGRAGGAGKDAGFIIEGVQGPMARSVQDCALFLDAMSGYNPQFPISFPAPQTSFQQAVNRADGRLKIAFTPDLAGMSPVDDQVENHLRKVLVLLNKNGATIEETCPQLPDLEKTYHTLRGILWATLAKSVGPEIRKHFKATLEQNTQMGEALTIDEIVDAQLKRTTIYNNMVGLFETFDVLACPTVGCMPHLQTEEWVSNIGGKTLDFYMDWLRFAFLATVTGLPAISVPVGLDQNGLPMAMQLIGKPRGEADLLSAARAVEIAVGGPLGPIDPIQVHLSK